MTAPESPHIIHAITDYGSDNAVNEVIPRLRKYFGFGSVEILSSTIPNFNTVNNAFWIAQHALNAELPTLVYHNVAPRKDNTDSRKDNRGEQLLGIRLRNGAVVVGPNSGYSHSLLRDHIVECHEIFVGGTSQFRSRDVFIEPSALFYRRDPHLEIIEVDPLETIPELSEPVILHIDNYGNLKLNITQAPGKPGDHLVVTIDGHSVEATVAGGAFEQPEGTLGFVPGSSGWAGKRFYELFLRGASAADAIEHSKRSAEHAQPQVNPGDNVTVELAQTSSRQDPK